MTLPSSLRATQLSRLYDGQAVVNAVSLTLHPGKITGLLGKSGAGKSTLLRLLAGLERPDGGEVRRGETVLSSPAVMIPAEKRRIGLIFQDFALFPHLTALQNTLFGLNHLEQTNARAIAMDWLAQVHLSERASAYPHELSGGEQQRVAIARALAPSPVALLMDEPFSGLDPALREDVREIALNAVRASNTPALLVTHDAREAMLSVDELAVMRDGKILQQAAPETVYAQPVDKETATALGPITTLTGHYSTKTNRIDTLFGPVTPRNTPQMTGAIHIAIRPESLILDPGSPFKAKLLSCRRDGPMIQVIVEKDGHQAQALFPAQTQMSPGDHIGIRLLRDACLLVMPTDLSSGHS